MPKTVISNTSPLQYLYQLGYLAFLQRFYHQVRIPPAVVRELAVGRALGVPLPDPATVAWLQVHVPVHDETLHLANALGTGERKVLALALQTSDALVLLDDGRARRIGHRLGLCLTGTVGVLARATREGMISQLAPVLDQRAKLRRRSCCPGTYR